CARHPARVRARNPAAHRQYELAARAQSVPDAGRQRASAAGAAFWLRNHLVGPRHGACRCVSGLPSPARAAALQAGEEFVKYISTRGQAEPVDFAGACLAGLATDGGLYVPETWPQIAPATPDET